jgi:hypothetical protein
MKPTIGKIVIYQSYGGPRAAIITEIDAVAIEEPIVSLCIFNTDRLLFNKRVIFSKELKPGHWSWGSWSGEVGHDTVK